MLPCVPVCEVSLAHYNISPDVVLVLGTKTCAVARSNRGVVLHAVAPSVCTGASCRVKVKGQLALTEPSSAPCLFGVGFLNDDWAARHVVGILCLFCVCQWLPGSWGHVGVEQQPFAC